MCLDKLENDFKVLNHFFQDWHYFSLFSEPKLQRSCKIDLIEVENPQDTDFNYYGITIDLDNAEEIIKP